ncbi:Phosphoenolpyruvate carboxylase [Micromonospora lupini str. Lupac 08]|uniref:Phosphoenolpyruvate carboxylase n=1 Tax=Micromonospora lupini str. Lupac 08 TaxID=1150864 RepID=I0LEF8_9ACTN|nr:Phosphoenolpyruvate carboxylase [Micromonospora lupini str. Lupac 08]
MCHAVAGNVWQTLQPIDAFENGHMLPSGNFFRGAGGQPARGGGRVHRFDDSGTVVPPAGVVQWQNISFPS